MINPKIILISSGILVFIGIAITVYQSQTIGGLDNKQQNYSETMTILDVLVSAVLVIGLGGLAVGILYLVKSRAK